MLNWDIETFLEYLDFQQTLVEKIGQIWDLADFNMDFADILPKQKQKQNKLELREILDSNSQSISERLE